MQKIRTALLWEILNNDMHTSLQESDRTVEMMIPLINALFPGIEYRSADEVFHVLTVYVAPGLIKRYPELLVTPMEFVKPETMTEITEVLSCKGYEWITREWNQKFEKFLVAKVE